MGKLKAGADTSDRRKGGESRKIEGLVKRVDKKERSLWQKKEEFR